MSRDLDAAEVKRVLEFTRHIEALIDEQPAELHEGISGTLLGVCIGRCCDMGYTEEDILVAVRAATTLSRVVPVPPPGSPN